MRWSTPVLLLLYLCAVAVPARAAGFLMSKFGGDLAYPTSLGAVSVFWNPAAMAFEPGTSVVLEGSLYFRRVDYERAEPQTDHPSNVGAARLDNVAFLPFIGAKSDFGLDCVSFGLAAYPLFGMRTSWEDPEGPQRWHTINGDLVSWYVTGAVGVRLPWNLSLGGSVSYVRTTIETLRATSITMGLDPETNRVSVAYGDDPSGEGRAWLDTGHHGVAYSFGVFFAPVAQLLIGISYLSRIEVDARGTLRQADATGLEERQSAGISQTFPDSVHLGVEYFPVERLGLRFGVSWVHWSLFDRQVLSVRDALGPGLDARSEIPRDWRDTVIVRGGARYRLFGWVTPYVGIGYDQGPAPGRTLEGALFDLDKIGFSIGAVIDPWKHLRLTVGYNRVFFLSKSVRGSVQQPSANGSYAGALDIVNLNIEFLL